MYTGDHGEKYLGQRATIVSARFQKVKQINFNCRPQPGPSPSNRTLPENAYRLGTCADIDSPGKQLSSKLRWASETPKIKWLAMKKKRRGKKH